MSNAKKGLRLLSLSIILNITWGVIYRLLIGNSQNLSDVIVKFLSYGVIITSVVALICYVIDLVGLHIAGKDNKQFHRASFLKIISLVLAFVCFILGVIAFTNESAAKGIQTASNVINIFTSIAEVVVLLSIIKGCKVISPRVRGQANFVFVCYVIQVACMIGLSFLATEALSYDHPGQTALVGILVLAVIFAIAALLYAIFYIILIFRATANVGKARK